MPDIFDTISPGRAKGDIFDQITTPRTNRAPTTPAYAQHAFAEINANPGISKAEQYRMLEGYRASEGPKPTPTGEEYADTPVSGVRGALETTAQAVQAISKGALKAEADIVGTVAPQTAQGFASGVEATYPTAPTLTNQIASSAGGFVPLVLAGPYGKIAQGVTMGVQSFGGRRMEAAERRERGENVSPGQEYGSAVASGGVGLVSPAIPLPIGKYLAPLSEGIAGRAVARGVENAVIAAPFHVGEQAITQATYGLPLGQTVLTGTLPAMAGAGIIGVAHGGIEGVAGRTARSQRDVFDQIAPEQPQEAGPQIPTLPEQRPPPAQRQPTELRDIFDQITAPKPQEPTAPVQSSPVAGIDAGLSEPAMPSSPAPAMSERSAPISFPQDSPEGRAGWIKFTDKQMVGLEVVQPRISGKKGEYPRIVRVGDKDYMLSAQDENGLNILMRPNKLDYAPNTIKEAPPAVIASHKQAQTTGGDELIGTGNVPSVGPARNQEVRKMSPVLLSPEQLLEQIPSNLRTPKTMGLVGRIEEVESGIAFNDPTKSGERFRSKATALRQEYAGEVAKAAEQASAPMEATAPPPEAQKILDRLQRGVKEGIAKENVGEANGGKPAKQKYKFLTKPQQDEAMRYAQRSGTNGIYRDKKGRVLITRDRPHGLDSTIIDRNGAAEFQGSGPIDRKVWSEMSLEGESDLPPEGNRVSGFGGPVTLAKPARPSFVNQDVKPAAREAASAIGQSWDSIKKTFAPQTRGPQARTAAGDVRAMASELAHRHDVAETALKKASGAFDKMPVEATRDFIGKMEDGNKQTLPELDPVAGKLRELLDNRRAQVQALGKGKLENFIENYFPHIWKDPDKAKSVLAQFISKRPLEGSKAFLKKRSIDSFAKGIELGLEPVSENPIELALMKVKEMDRYILTHKMLEEIKGQGLLKYVSVNDKAAEGYAKINDSVASVYGPPTIAVKEHVDRAQHDALEEVVKNLGISHERVSSAMSAARKRGAKGLPRGLLGVAFEQTNEAFSQYGTGVQVMAHEIGHHIDYKYDLDKVVGTNVRELDALSKLHAGGDWDKLSEKKKEYLLSPPEQMAQVVEAYVAAREKFKETAPNAYAAFEKFIDAHQELEPLKTVPSLALKQLTTQKPHGGLLKMGEYYAPEPAAQVLNNYLSPGLGGNKAFRGFRAVSNVMNQAQLGWSAFHAGFTTFDVAVSKMALGFEKIAEGKIGAGIKDIAVTPAAPITNVIRGNTLYNEWMKPGSTGNAEAAQMVGLMKQAGGRVRQSPQFEGDMVKKMVKAWRQGNVVGAAIRAPLATTELVAKPIMNWLVLRQKLGVFWDLARNELSKLPPDTSKEQIRAAMGKAWDSVDRRMGQVVYDNLFWNKTAKDLSHALVRSVGWNVGTAGEVGGGILDAGKMATDLVRGKRPELTHRTAYVAALFTLGGIVGGTLNYMMSGERPKEAKDYFFPRTGGVDERGNPIRLALPTYIKDVYGAKDHPLRMLGNKTSPAISAISQMAQNKDYFGTEIRHPDDSIWKQAVDMMEFAAKQALPFSVRNYQKMNQEGEPMLKRLAGAVGITQASPEYSLTPAQKLAREYAMSERPVGARTQEQSDKSQLIYELSNRVRKNATDGWAGIREAIKAKKILPQDVAHIQERARLAPLQYQVKHLNNVEQAVKVYEAADDKEKKLIRTEIIGKIWNSKSIDYQRKRELISRISAKAA